MLKLFLIIFLLILFYQQFSVVKIENVLSPIKYYKNGVPNIIFRATGNLSMRKYRKRYCYDKWLELNPEHNFLWFDNAMQEEFIRNYMPERIFKTYKKLIPGAYKADLWRLCILYIFGGIYADEYATPYVSVKTMLKNIKNNFIASLDCDQQGIHNGFIISTRNNRILSKTIEIIVENVEKEYYGISALSPTGPLALAKAVKKLYVEKFKIGDNGFMYLFEHKWGPYQNIYKGPLKILSKKYSFFDAIHKTFFTNGYYVLWKKREIYRK